MINTLQKQNEFNSILVKAKEFEICTETKNNTVIFPEYSMSNMDNIFEIIDPIEHTQYNLMPSEVLTLLYTLPVNAFDIKFVISYNLFNSGVSYNYQFINNKVNIKLINQNKYHSIAISPNLIIGNMRWTIKN